MATNVFINGREACSKAADGKSAAAFPDPCWTPPQPAPVTVPYPNSAEAKSLKNGTSTVFIKKSMVALEDRSYFSTSDGNEAATESLPKGVVTMTIEGKAYFKSWSGNVKFEGKGVARHRDLMTHNHASDPPNTPPFYYIDTEDLEGPCASVVTNINTECAKTTGKEDANRATIADHRDGKKHFVEGEGNAWMLSHCEGLFDKPGGTEDPAKEATNKAIANDCLNARKCAFIPYEHTKAKAKESAWSGAGCCPGQTGHHLLPDGMFRDVSDKAKNVKFNEYLSDLRGSLSQAKNDLSGAQSAVNTAQAAVKNAVGDQKVAASEALKAAKDKLKEINKTISDAEPVINGDRKAQMKKYFGKRDNLPKRRCWGNYTEDKGPTVCLEGINQHYGSHGEFHNFARVDMEEYMSSDSMDYTTARDMMANYLKDKFGCPENCTIAQLDNAFRNLHDEECGDLSKATVKPHSGNTGDGLKGIAPNGGENGNGIKY